MTKLHGAEVAFIERRDRVRAAPFGDGHDDPIDQAELETAVAPVEVARTRDVVRDTQCVTASPACAHCLPLDARIYDAAVARCVARGLRSGAVFDALRVICAERARADVLVTTDMADFERLVGSGGPRIVPCDTSPEATARRIRHCSVNFPGLSFLRPTAPWRAR